MNITLTPGTGAGTNFANVPAATLANWQAAATILDNMFTDNITVTLQIDYQGTGGGADAGPGHIINGNQLTGSGLGETYSSIYSYLTTNKLPGDTTFQALPNAASIGGQSTIVVWDAQLKLMGLNPATGDANYNGVDGGVQFTTDIASNAQIAVALHEFTHAMGRVPGTDIFGFYRFTSPGNYFFNSGTGTASYFSLNGGQVASKWANYGVGSDPSDFLNDSLTGNNLSSPTSIYFDPFSEIYNPGFTQNYLLPSDIEQMDALGYHPKFDSPAANPYDFVGNGNGDVLIQSNTGQIDYATMLGGVFQTYVAVGSTPGFNVVGQGKIVGNGSSDVVVQNAGGQIDYAILANGSFSSWGAVAPTPGFTAGGVGDINGDHYADIVVENHNTGEIDYANMNGGVFHTFVAVGTAPGFNVIGVGDVNGDGYADVVVQNASNSGEIDYANMNGGVFSGWKSVGFTPGWNAVGVGDINRDGFADVVIQNQSTNQIAYANMNGGVLGGFVNVGTTPGFTVSAIEDVIGNGFDDIVVQNPGTGEIDYANMTGGTFQGWGAVGTTPGFAVVTTPAPTGSQTVASVSAASLGLLADSGSAVLSPTTLHNFGTA